MSFHEWKLNEANEAAAGVLAAQCGIGLLTARVLASRGYTDPALVRGLIFCEAPMESPFDILDMNKAAARIRAAVSDGQRIGIFGDYDVDGVTATALLYSYLTSVAESEVIFRLPDRRREGYGLSRTAIDELAERSVQLIITVDNGITAIDEVDYANSLGIDVIVCDHHRGGAEVPRAVAVVDPNREGCPSKFKELAGVGVALKLCAAVEACPPEQILDYFGYLAALGTVADVMPLVSENRQIVQTGLEQLRQGANPGLSALLELASIKEDELTARSIAFGIAPRLNAAGRIESAGDSLMLLLDEENCEEYAQKIDGYNRTRRALEEEAEQRIQSLFLADPSLLAKPVIVVGDTGLAGGIIGIVASRLVDRYGKPAIVYTDDGTLLKGSCRSVDGFSIYDALAYAGDCLERFGGHTMAAGLSLRRGNLSAFVGKLTEYCRMHPVPHGVLEIDCAVQASDLTLEQVGRLSELEPFGRCNEQPVFALYGVLLSAIQALAEKYVAYQVKAGEQTLRFADFSLSVADCPYREGDTVDIAFTAGINRSGGREFLSLRVVEMRAHDFKNSELATADIFERLDVDAPWQAENSAIAITRADVAAVYTALRAGRYNERDLSPLVVKCRLPAGKVLAACRTLKELGLVYAGSLRPKKTAAKRDLADSATFFYLNRGGN